MHRKPAVVLATSVSAALLAASTSFAIANGVFGSRRSDRVGTFQEINARLAPATRPVTSHPTPTNASIPTTGTAADEPAIAALQPPVAPEPWRSGPPPSEPVAEPPESDPPRVAPPPTKAPRTIDTTMTTPHRDKDDDGDGGRGRDD